MSRERTIDQKLATFRSCFSGLLHVYGTYELRTGRVWQVKQPVTDGVLLDHIEGRQPYGVYLLVQDRTRALAVDFDDDDLLPPMEFIRAARHYGIAVYLERSKAKGYHAWMLFGPDGVLAARARLVAHHILTEIQRPFTEIFPKQDVLHGDAFYGNFINVPLFGRMIERGRTVFVDPSNPTLPHPDQWGLLEQVQRVPASLLDQIIDVNDLVRTFSATTRAPASSPAGPKRTFGLLPCARRMLESGVAVNQRVACFRLAVQLRRTGLPQDMAVLVLKGWATRNRPLGGKRIITDEEIGSQVDVAYRNNYAGFGCETEAIAPYCDPGCPLKTRASSPAARGSDRLRDRS